MTDMHSGTASQISEITSPGLFERLATSVLRSADPLYRNIIHTGINAKGQPITDPVDGICISEDAFGQKFAIAIEHTTEKRPKLSGKWLHPEKGDLSKALKRLRQYVDEFGQYTLRIVVTCSVTPSSDLVKKVEQFGAENSVGIDIWSNDRIAYELDTSADGQTIRTQFFGIPQTRLSTDLAREISRKQVAAQQTFVAIDQLLVRCIEDALPGLSRHRGNIAFITGNSGIGKTSLCHLHALNIIENGGIALVLTHQVLSVCETLDQAILMCLRNFESSLVIDRPLLAIMNLFLGQRIFLWIEDVNKSTAPADLISKLDQFSRLLQSENGLNASDIMIYCPVWPQNLRGLTDEARRSVEAKTLELQQFTNIEATRLVGLSTGLSRLSLTDLEAGKIAESLANDPLLISLMRDKATATASKMIPDYIQRCLERCAHDSGLSIYTFRNAASALAKWLIQHRVQTPNLADLHLHFNGTEVFKCIEVICSEGSLFREITQGDEQVLNFRHDRIRDFLVIQAIQSDFADGNFTEEYVTDPFYVELVSQAAINTKMADTFRHVLTETNPLGLFCALKLAVKDNLNIVQSLLAMCLDFVSSGSLDALGDYNRLAIEWQIAELTGKEFSALIKATRVNSHAGRKARILNGDVNAAAALCYDHEPSLNSLYRDRLVAHAREKYGQSWFDDLCILLSQPNISEKQREAFLYLAGECAEACLVDAILNCWENMKAQGEQLSCGMLYAAVSCGAGVTDFPLDEFFEYWESLPEEDPDINKPWSNPRYAVAEFGLSAGLRRIGVSRTIKPLLNLVKKVESMGYLVYGCLDNIDHPLAANYVASYLAQIDKLNEGQEDASNHLAMSRLSFFGNGYDHHVRFTKPTMESLKQIWSDSGKNIHDRKRSFQLWSTSMNTEDCVTIANRPPLGLEDEALIARCRYDDRSVIPDLQKKLLSSDEKHSWLQFIRHFGSIGFEDVILAELERRNIVFQAGDVPDTRSDYFIPDLLAERDDVFAENAILSHWHHLKDCWGYPQLLLYLSTPKTLKLFADSYQNTEDKSELFKLLNRTFGFQYCGRSGIKRVEQLTGLEPYLDDFDDNLISTLWDECTKKGFVSWRIKNLDHRISKDNHIFAKICEDAAFRKIDEDLNDDNRIERVAYFWSETRDEQQENRKTQIGLTKRYAENRSSPRAVEFLAEVTKIIGIREHLDDLAKYREKELLSSKQYDDACFSVQQRSLQ